LCLPSDSLQPLPRLAAMGRSRSHHGASRSDTRDRRRSRDHRTSQRGRSSERKEHVSSRHRRAAEHLETVPHAERRPPSSNSQVPAAVHDHPASGGRSRPRSGRRHRDRDRDRDRVDAERVVTPERRTRRRVRVRRRRCSPESSQGGPRSASACSGRVARATPVDDAAVDSPLGGSPTRSSRAPTGSSRSQSPSEDGETWMQGMSPGGSTFEYTVSGKVRRPAPSVPPARWDRFTFPDGRPFWINAASGEQTFVNPSGSQPLQVKPAAPRSGAPAVVGLSTAPSTAKADKLANVVALEQRLKSVRDTLVRVDRQQRAAAPEPHLGTRGKAASPAARGPASPASTRRSSSDPTKSAQPPADPHSDRAVLRSDKEVDGAIWHCYDLLSAKGVSSHPATSVMLVFAREVPSETALQDSLIAMGIQLIGGDSEGDPVDKVLPYCELNARNPYIPAYRLTFSLTPPLNLTLEYTVSKKQLAIKASRAAIAAKLPVLVKFFGRVADLNAQRAPRVDYRKQKATAAPSGPTPRKNDKPETQKAAVPVTELLLKPAPGRRRGGDRAPTGRR